MAVWKINNIICWQRTAKCHSEPTKGTNNKRNPKPKHAHTDTETHSSYKRYRSVKQDYPAAGEQDDALKIPQTAQQSVAALNLSYVNLYASATRWYRLNTHFPRTSSKRMQSMSVSITILTRDRTQFFLEASLSRAQDTLRLGLVSPSSTSPQ